MTVHVVDCYVISALLILHLEVCISQLIWPLPLFNESQDSLVRRNIHAERELAVDGVSPVDLPKTTPSLENVSAVNNNSNLHVAKKKSKIFHWFTVEALAFTCSIFVVAIVIVIFIMICTYCTTSVAMREEKRKSKENDEMEALIDAPENDNFLEEASSAVEKEHLRKPAGKKFLTKKRDFRTPERIEQGVKGTIKKGYVSKNKSTNGSGSYNVYGKQSERSIIPKTADQYGDTGSESEFESPKTRRSMSRQADHLQENYTTSSSSEPDAELIKNQSKSEGNRPLSVDSKSGKKSEFSLKGIIAEKNFKGNEKDACSNCSSNNKALPLVCTLCQGCGGIRVS